MSRLFDNNSIPIVTKIEPSGADFIFGEGNLAQFLEPNFSLFKCGSRYVQAGRQ